MSFLQKLFRRNTEPHHYTGRIFTLDLPIVNGSGKVIIGESMWKLVGPDTPAGTTVRVLSVDGVTMTVGPADALSPVAPE